MNYHFLYQLFNFKYYFKFNKCFIFNLFYLYSLSVRNKKKQIFKKFNQK